MSRKPIVITIEDQSYPLIRSFTTHYPISISSCIVFGVINFGVESSLPLMSYMIGYIAPSIILPDSTRQIHALLLIPISYILYIYINWNYGLSMFFDGLSLSLFFWMKSIFPLSLSYKLAHIHLIVSQHVLLLAPALHAFNNLVWTAVSHWYLYYYYYYCHYISCYNFPNCFIIAIFAIGYFVSAWFPTKEQITVLSPDYDSA